MGPIIMSRFSFAELCDTGRGAFDYRVIARAFDVVIVEDIPTMNLDEHNRARRFITLIDELYEGRCALLCSAVDAKSPVDLFESRDNNHDIDVDKDIDNGTDDGNGGSNNCSKNNINVVVDGGSGDGNGAELFNDRIEWIDVAQQGGTPVGALASVRELA